MKKYVIERPIPGVGSLTRNQLHAGSAKSCAVLEELGPDIQWVQSYVTADKIYCVYLAANEELIREHARRSGFPAASIADVRAIIDPTMASAATGSRRVNRRDLTLATHPTFEHSTPRPHT
jgi:hypothetical protein